MDSDYKSLTHCVACDSHQLTPVLDLGVQPLANNLLTSRWQKHASYPLQLNRCKDCFHAQLSVAVRPELMFKHYLYVSGTSQTLRDYCAEFAQRATDRLGVGSVLDVACNDGTQLNSFRELGWQTYGIDPADNLKDMHNHDVEVDFCENVDREYSVELITAQNVLAHTAHPVKLLKRMRKWLKPGGEILIQTSQANMFLNAEFDTMYHEHISFFCVQSMKSLARRAGLYLTDVDFTDIHGTSYVFTLKLENVAEITDYPDAHRYTQGVYESFQNHAQMTMAQTKIILDGYRQSGYSILGFGAAAKGITFLNASGIKLDGILEDNHYKCGRFTPGSAIPISTTEFTGWGSRVVFLVLAWNFYPEIKAKLTQLAKDYQCEDVRFVTYFPEFLDEKFTS